MYAIYIYIFSLLLISDLANMYRLLNPIHGALGVLIQEVEDHIKQVGLEAVADLKGDSVSTCTVNRECTT